ncbi:MAG: DUF480 domain-containing protein [Planctomycetes bacterium]|nr:DUF480 domain-containing protein [Planctomycetota bacterium]
MTAKLTTAELRVLGVLIEKSLTQPGSYPLTLNALVLGCNQKQNRDPVVEFGESDVSRAIHTLQLPGRTGSSITLWKRCTGIAESRRSWRS